mgnify:CR=1 FL=1
MMDFYELTMANGYFKDHDKDVQVAFDVFYRQNPDEGGFAIFAGLEQVIEYVENMTFTDEDVEYFRQQHMFSEEFLTYLKNFHFKGDIYAMPEGTVMYPNEPILTVSHRSSTRSSWRRLSSRRSTTSRYRDEGAPHLQGGCWPCGIGLRRPPRP